MQVEIATGNPAGRIPTRVYSNRQEMGYAAAIDIADALRMRLSNSDSARVIFASAPSQLEMLQHLATAPDIDWQRVTAFHMDEYIGLSASAPQRFGSWLEEHFLNRIEIGQFHLLKPEPDPLQAALDYAQLLSEKPIDVVCLGIGINGHLAFNDPPVADLHDPADVKQVELDEICRQQQVDDQCFEHISHVPTHAITLTLPRLMRATKLFCVVPGAAKKKAVTAALRGPITTDCPASIMQQHPGCALYLDSDSNPDV